MKCKRCRETAVIALPSHHAGFCEECFLLFFTRQVETGIRRHKLLERDDRVLVALSGGKDSLSLMLELSAQGYDVTGLHVDLGIAESSAKARGKVEAFCARHGLGLEVLELEAEGMPIPELKRHVHRPICSVCGKVKRYYFNKFAVENGFDALATGHNLDDEAARLFANSLRWDTGYLADQGPVLPATEGFVKKVKPLWRLSEYETAAYAFLRGIEIHSDPCPYSPGASFTNHKMLIEDLEFKSPGQKFAFYDGFLRRGRAAFEKLQGDQGEQLSPCPICGSPTSVDLCGVCRLRDLLDRKRAEAE